MGKPKQRHRLSKGFALEQNALKIVAREIQPMHREDAASVPESKIPGLTLLKKIQSGKIIKPGKKIRKQKTSHLTPTQILDVAEQLQGIVAPSSVTNATGDAAAGPITISTTRKQMKTQIRSKKERLVMKKHVFQRKIELIKQVEKSKKETKAREKTVIVGDMKPILDALPSVPADSDLQSLVNQCYSEINAKINPKRTKLKMKTRNREIEQGLNYFDMALKKK